MTPKQLIDKAIAEWNGRADADNQWEYLGIDEQMDCIAAFALAQPVQLADDLEALRTDSDRYRWLRNALVATDAEFFIAVDSVHHDGRWALPVDEVDTAIDAAMARHNNLQPLAQPVPPAIGNAVHQIRPIGTLNWGVTDSDGETAIKRMPHWQGKYEFRTLYELAQPVQTKDKP